MTHGASYHANRETREARRGSVSGAAGEKSRDSHEKNCAHCRSRQATEESKHRNVEPLKDPSADYGAHEPEDNISKATKPAAARNGPGDPSGDEPDDDPQNKAIGRQKNVRAKVMLNAASEDRAHVRPLM